MDPSSVDPTSMFAGMDPALAKEAEKMWKKLETMSADDPEAYNEFIKQQMQMGAAEGLVPATPDMPIPGVGKRGWNDIRICLQL